MPDKGHYIRHSLVSANIGTISIHNKVYIVASHACSFNSGESADLCALSVLTYRWNDLSIPIVDKLTSLMYRSDRHPM